MDLTIKETSSKAVVFYFQVHQPKRLRGFQYLDIGVKRKYFDDELNETIMKRVAHDCYIPANAMLLEVLLSNPDIKLCFSISGEAINQMEKYAPEALEGFKLLANTGQVEFFAETYHHSLASFISPQEFQEQVVEHAELILNHFGLRPTVFRNTELIYNDDIGSAVSKMGYQGIVIEGAESVTISRDKNAVYYHPHEDIRLIVRDTKLSENIAARFGGGESRLKVNEFVTAINQSATDSNKVLIGFNYETLGEQLHREEGILTFLQEVLKTIADSETLILSKATEAIASIVSPVKLSIKNFTSWCGDERDVSAWIENDMQQEALGILKAQEEKIGQVADEELLDIWRTFQTSDNFYYMSTKRSINGMVHDYFSHYPSPYEAFINYTNALNDFALSLQAAPAKLEDSEHAKVVEYERQHPKAPMWAMQKESRTRLPSDLNV